MHEPFDTSGWVDTMVPSGVSVFDCTLFGCLRFSSIFPQFPLSIAFPAWSHPILDVDARGFGSLGFKGAFTVRRMSLPRYVTRSRDIRDFAVDQFQSRSRVDSPNDWAEPENRPELQSVQLRVDLREAIPRARVAGAIESDMEQEIFFTTSFEPTLWTFTRHRVDLDEERANDFLRSIAWLDPLWFAAYPAL